MQQSPDYFNIDKGFTIHQICQVGSIIESI